MTASAGTALKICIIAHNAYGAVSGASSGARQVGGVQNQTALMARWLTSRGHKVSVITWDEGQPDGVQYGGVTIYKMCTPKAGVPGMRFVHPRMTSLFSAMKRAAADLYYYNAADAATGLAAFWCKMNRKPYVYSSAQEMDCHKDLPLFGKGKMHRSLDRPLYRYGLRNSTLIIVQTEKQRQLLEEGFALPSVRLPMPCAGPESIDLENRQGWDSKIVLWVARLAPVKRLEWLLEVAPLVPEARFLVIGANAQTPYAKDLYDRATKIKNIEWVGTVPIPEMKTYYARANCLCSTSTHEGFPNTFLETWSHGKPVVSTFDPDSLIASKNLGIMANSVEGLRDGLKKVLNDQAAWRELGANGRRYYEEYHAIDSAMERFETELVRVGKPNGKSKSLVPSGEAASV